MPEEEEVGVGEVMGNQIGLDCSEKNMHKKKKKMSLDLGYSNKKVKSEESRAHK